MSQYQVRTGPIQNDAAGFSQEMAQGAAPPKSRASQGPRIGLPAFIDVPSFSFESILASRLDNRNHLTKPQHVPAVAYPHQAAAFSPEMAAGVQGQTWPSPRILLGPKIPLPLAQTTHVQAALSPEMVSTALDLGTRVIKKRQASQQDLLSFDTFAYESIIASRIDNRNHLTYPKHRQPLSQTTHVAAAFSAEMAAGVTAPQPRILVPRRIGQPDWTFLDAFSFESVLAGCLDRRNHLIKPQHWDSLYQATHVPAAFQSSMTAGNVPLEPRILRPRQIGLPIVSFVDAFSFESVLALRLDARNHLTRPQHLQPLTQPTHVQAPFSLEMVSRVLDLRTRQGKPRQLSIADLNFIAPFAFESVLGSRLDNKNHLFLPKQVPPIAQPLHVVAPFSMEMVAGTQGPIAQNHFKWWPIGFRSDGSLLVMREGRTSFVLGTVSLYPALEGRVDISEALSSLINFYAALGGDLEIEP